MGQSMGHMTKGTAGVTALVTAGGVAGWSVMAVTAIVAVAVAFIAALVGATMWILNNADRTERMRILMNAARGRKSRAPRRQQLNATGGTHSKARDQPGQLPGKERNQRHAGRR